MFSTGRRIFNNGLYFRVSQLMFILQAKMSEPERLFDLSLVTPLPSEKPIVNQFNYNSAEIEETRRRLREANDFSGPFETQRKCRGMGTAAIQGITELYPVAEEQLPPA